MYIIRWSVQGPSSTKLRGGGSDKVAVVISFLIG